ncbi:MAG: EAL domain-containing response regulator [Alphaproteobacteria bacterium]|jgi:EAL domain-containing protein (putative c-di-GMP-specific phosphodiesterase class I)/FixJ family two-component response regulator|nr:EAL domain-containing response regulator [Alphaproteobacteria bacterium]MBT4018650.1 EAL domain-containing response regulator [Alphaproteobacteria bacterium]MBT5159796.1 EAL domain-containing response regulator [Alphaproteobacteria bacterium]
MTRSILVVDDELGICEFVQDVAQDMSFDVAITTSASEIVSVQFDALDAIVMDLSMPNMDGIELIRYLAENGCSAALILMSGLDSGVLATAERLARDRGLTVLGAITKPIDILTLEKLLELVPLIDRHQEVSNSGSMVDKSDFSVQELTQAVSQGQIKPWFQPRINLADMAFVGVEALARWQHPVKGMIPPDRFIPLAEESGLIDELTVSMVEQSLAEVARWQTENLTLDVSINYSALSLADLGLPDYLAGLVAARDLKADRVTVEVTESSVLTEIQNSLDVLTRLRMKGFQLSIDDFGTGFSSMQQLQNIPFTELKIDQSFVKRALSDKDAKAIVETTVDLGRRLVMSVIAEGVEDLETLELLKNYQCNQVQGYFIAKPMPGNQILEWATMWPSVASGYTG